MNARLLVFIISILLVHFSKARGQVRISIEYNAYSKVSFPTYLNKEDQKNGAGINLRYTFEKSHLIAAVHISRRTFMVPCYTKGFSQTQLDINYDECDLVSNSSDNQLELRLGYRYNFVPWFSIGISNIVTISEWSKNRFLEIDTDEFYFEYQFTDYFKQWIQPHVEVACIIPIKNELKVSIGYFYRLYHSIKIDPFYDAHGPRIEILF